ncbi:MAG: hypothetical protein AAGD14_03245 [Planctomycetota bacterium]
MRVVPILMLLTAWAVAEEAPEAAPDAAALEALTAAYNQATSAFFKPYREAQAKGEEYALDYSKHPRFTYAPKFAAMAKKAKGDVALDAWVMALRSGYRNRAEAIEAILADHIESKGMINVVGYVRWEKNGDALMQQIIARSPHRDVQGFAMLLRGQTMLRRGNPQAERVLAAAKEKYGDVSIYRGRFTVGEKADGDLYEARHLAVGKKAPDIEGEDVDGVAFKLSDYRGKVILLDFWGDW